MATDEQTNRVLGASAIISRLQEALDNYAGRIERGYVNIPVDAEAVKAAVTLLAETCATADNAGQVPA